MKKLITLLLVLVTLNGYSQSKEEIENYLDTIVHYVEGNKNRLPVTKYKKDITIYVDGDNMPHLNDELSKIIDDLNNLITSIEIKVVDRKVDCNMYIFFGTVNQYSKISEDILKNKHVNGFGEIYPDLNDDIFYTSVFINTGKVKNNDRQKHILREEITQVMGLTNDTYQYSNSMFYQGYSLVTEYSDIDKEVIKLFYN
tara:strand:- start:99 stop:695 length:597 start_codon:yes stop_codon:yes gene_type:complete